MSLFKYTSAETGIRILSQKKIRFSQASSFNDPYEIFPNVSKCLTKESLLELDKEMLQTMEGRKELSIPEHWSFNEIKKNYYTREHLNYWKNLLGLGIVTYARQYVGILCLSKTCKNILMWAHYSDCHRGMIIEFDDSHPFFTKLGLANGFACRKVKYCEKRPLFYLKKEDRFTPIVLLLKDYMFMKSSLWEYEEEYRAVRFLTSSRRKGNISLNDTLFAFPPKIIKSVILGCKISSSHTDRIKSILKSDKEYKHVLIKYAIEDTINFRLTIDCEK